MFEYLTEKYWEDFFKPVEGNQEKRPHDGKHFEDLVEALLEAMYSGTGISWIPTPPTHDGSRDFYSETDKDTILWAECKNYDKPIALKTIAPTIVMAQISHVAEILFFSYSPINNNTRNRLMLYASQTGKKIYFYDDKNLENLIFRYREKIIPHFFKNFTFLSSMKLDYTPYYFSKVGTGVWVTSEQNVSSETISVQLNDIVHIGVGVYNRHPEFPLYLTISIAAKHDIGFLRLLDKEYNPESEYLIHKKIEPQSTRFITFYFKLFSYKEKVKLPSFSLRCSCKDFQNVFTTNSPIIHVDHLFLSDLMGSNYHRLKDIFAKYFFNNFHVKVLALEGPSGVGKTRMLHEYISILLFHKYHILSFPGVLSDCSSIQVIKEIIYNLYQLSEEMIIEALKEPQNYETVFGGEIQYVIEMLQELNQGDTKKLFANESFIFEKMITSKVAILIDNLQFFDSIMLKFVKDYCLYAKNVNRPNKCIVLFTCNTDYNRSNELIELYSILRMISESSNHKIMIESLAGFENRDNESDMEIEPALGYLKAIISVEDNSYDYILINIVETAKRNPKLILEVARYLQQKKILQTGSNSLLIENYKELEYELRQFPFSENNIIQRRWEAFILGKENDLEVMNLLLSSVNFWGFLTSKQVTELNLPSYLPNSLVCAGFLDVKKSENGYQFFFEHDLIRNFFIYSFPVQDKIIYYLAKHSEITVYLTPWQNQLIAIARGENITTSIISSCLDITFFIPYGWQIYYYTEIVKYLMDKLDCISEPDDLLRGIHTVCLRVKNRFGTEKALELYEILYPQLNNALENWLYSYHAYYEFLDGYTENLLHMGDQRVEDVYLKHIELLEHTPELFPDILGKLYNRVYVYNKDKYMESYSHEYYEKCMRLCDRYQLSELKMLNYFDAGNYSLYGDYDIPRLNDYWRNGFCIYESEKFEDAFLFIARKEIQSCFLNRQYDLIESKLQAAHSYLNNKKESVQQALFFYKGFGMLKIMYMLMFRPDQEDLTKVMATTLEYNSLTNAKKMFGIYFFYAKYYFQKMRYEDMIHYFELCLENLDIYKTYFYYTSYRQIIIDDFKIKMAIALAEHKILNLSINNKKMCSVYKELLQNNNLMEYVNQFVTISPIASPDNKDGYIFI